MSTCPISFPMQGVRGAMFPPMVLDFLPYEQMLICRSVSSCWKTFIDRRLKECHTFFPERSLVQLSGTLSKEIQISELVQRIDRFYASISGSNAFQQSIFSVFTANNPNGWFFLVVRRESALVPPVNLNHHYKCVVHDPSLTGEQLNSTFCMRGWKAGKWGPLPYELTTVISGTLSPALSSASEANIIAICQRSARKHMERTNRELSVWMKGVIVLAEMDQPKVRQIAELCFMGLSLAMGVVTYVLNDR